MPNYLDILGSIRTTISNFVNGLVNRMEIHEYPKKDDERVSGWVSQLFEDALAFRKHSFEQTKDGRFGYSDPVRFWQQMAAIASGNHYAAFGTRKVKTDGTDGDIWKAEMIDDETSDQMRVRTAHLTAGWHEVQVMPNTDYIDDVLREERKQTGWGKFVRRSIKNAQQYGFAWAQSYLDKSENPEGIANERVLPVGSVFLSPYATSKAKRDGCWYAVIAENVTGQWVRENLPDFNLSQAGSESHTSERSRNIDRKSVV